MTNPVMSPTTTSITTSNNTSGGISGGAIGGILVGAVFGVVILSLLVFLYFTRRRNVSPPRDREKSGNIGGRTEVGNATMMPPPDHYGSDEGRMRVSYI